MSLPLESISDEAVLAVYADDSRARAEREAAFHELVDRYQRRLFAVCVRVLGSAADAEDAVQETFIRLARHAAGFRGEARLSTWLYRVARNVCTDLVRHDARRPATPVEDIGAVADGPDASDQIEAHLAAIGIEPALRQLDDTSRMLLLLVAVDGLSYAEAAELVELPVGTVKSRVSRARVRLGQLLVEAEHAPPLPAPSRQSQDRGNLAPDPDVPPSTPP